MKNQSTGKSVHVRTSRQALRAVNLCILAAAVLGACTSPEYRADVLSMRPIRSTVHANVDRYQFPAEVDLSVIQCIVAATQELEVELNSSMTNQQQKDAFREVVLEAIQNEGCDAGLDIEVNLSEPNGTVWATQNNRWYAHPFMGNSGGQNLVVTTFRDDLNAWITCDISVKRP